MRAKRLFQNKMTPAVVKIMASFASRLESRDAHASLVMRNPARTQRACGSTHIFIDALIERRTSSNPGAERVHLLYRKSSRTDRPTKLKEASAHAVAAVRSIFASGPRAPHPTHQAEGKSSSPKTISSSSLSLSSGNRPFLRRKLFASKIRPSRIFSGKTPLSESVAMDPWQ